MTSLIINDERRFLHEYYTIVADKNSINLIIIYDIEIKSCYP